ncbi:hypothetical protein BDZ89DRAFT_1120123 [Hymenopellis radicata]|nr:hypothetical protein BDZ89DRAFT_1120123 [Hymenopellis radicata]
MPQPRDLVNGVLNFRLGYNLQRPYPGRWTTPIVCGVFVGLTILLAFVNIPLAAYDVVQEFTYTPNDTTNALPFSSLVPSSLRHSAGDFMPQTFKIGDTIQTNLSAFDYQILTAYQNELPSKAVASFPYYNNALSTCDVANLTLSVRKEERASISASIGCWLPIMYTMTMELNHAALKDRTAGFLGAVRALDSLLVDLEYGWSDETVVLSSDVWHGPDTPQNATGMDLSVYPCCVCGGTPSSESNRGSAHSYGEDVIGHLSCDNETAQFSGTYIQVYYANGTYGQLNMVDILPSSSDLQVPANVRLVLENTFQAIYHLIRLDLGIIRENQMYTSAAAYNQSISAVPLFSRFAQINGTAVPATVLSGGIMPRPFDSYANITRQDRATESYLSYGWDEALDVRVPSVIYLRPVFRQKPTASAAASVFVSTFAMVSALWKLFTLIAGGMMSSPATNDSPAVCVHCQNGKKSRFYCLIDPTK